MLCKIQSGRGTYMDPHSAPHSRSRRNFMTTTGGLLAAAVTSPRNTSALLSPAERDSSSNSMPTARKIPIGVVDPVFNHSSLEQMIEKISALGIEAVEIGTGGFPGTPHCPVQELLTDNAKLRSWKKKFEDRNIQVAVLSCHGNPVHPDPKIAERDAEIFRRTVQLAERLGVDVIVGLSGCPGGNPTDTMHNWATYRSPPEYAKILDWQWKEKVIPYWKQAAKLAREHGVHKLALEMHPGFVVYNPMTLLKLREAVGEEIGANCDLSHLFWQGCDPIGVIRILSKQGALFHAQMKDRGFFPENNDRFGLVYFAYTANDSEQ